MSFFVSAFRKKMKGEELELPPGFRFHPTDEELVNYYLTAKCAGLPISVPVIADIDLYKFDPWQLPGIYIHIYIYMLLWLILYIILCS